MIISDQEVDEQETDEQLSNYPPAQKGVTLTKNYSMIYWREGILVIYEMGKFLIESFTDHVRMIYLLLFFVSLLPKRRYVGGLWYASLYFVAIQEILLCLGSQRAFVRNLIASCDNILAIIHYNSAGPRLDFYCNKYSASILCFCSTNHKQFRHICPLTDQFEIE